MILQDDYALTEWTDPDTGAEYEIKILFSYQPSERPDYEDGLMTYPGCPAGIVDMQIERKALVGLDVWDWVEFHGETEREMLNWQCDIMEAIQQQFIDGRGEE